MRKIKIPVTEQEFELRCISCRAPATRLVIKKEGELVFRLHLCQECAGNENLINDIGRNYNA